MADSKTLIYWLDATGPEDFDEIVRLTLIDAGNKVLFNHVFSTLIGGTAILTGLNQKILIKSFRLKNIRVRYRQFSIKPIN